MCSQPLVPLVWLGICYVDYKLTRDFLCKMNVPHDQSSGEDQEQISEDIENKNQTLKGLMSQQQKHLCNRQNLDLKYCSCDLTAQCGITYVSHWFNYFFPCSTNISTRACACVSVMWESCAVCDETQLSKTQEEMFWVMMVNVCACGPGQQHFPAGRSWSGCWLLFI